MEEAHRKSFEEVCKVVSKEIIKKSRIMKLSQLRDLYVLHLQETQFANPNYRGEKLKSKLERYSDYQGLLDFCPVGAGGKFRSYLVFNSKMDISDAIRTSQASN